MRATLLDTNLCIAFLNGEDEAVRDRLLTLAPDDARLCSVVKAELLYGAHHSQRVAENLARLEAFFAPDDEAAEWYGVIRSQLRREGTPIGGNDLMIAATARAAGLTLATRNQGEFRRVPGLRVEVW